MPSSTSSCLISSDTRTGFLWLLHPLRSQPYNSNRFPNISTYCNAPSYSSSVWSPLFQYFWSSTMLLKFLSFHSRSLSSLLPPPLPATHTFSLCSGRSWWMMCPVCRLGLWLPSSWVHLDWAASGWNSSKGWPLFAVFVCVRARWW